VISRASLAAGGHGAALATRSLSRLALGALLAVALERGAGAHQNSVVYLELDARGSEVALRLRASLLDLHPLLGVSSAVRPLPALYQLKREAVLRQLGAYITVAGRQRVCDLRRRELTAADTGVEVALGWDCGRRVDELQLRYDLLFDDDAAHRAFLRVVGEGSGPVRHVFGRAEADRVFRLETRVSAWHHVLDFLVLGVQHIFTGYDHILFLLALLLLAGALPGDMARSRGQLRAGLIYLLRIVTAFTIAHSITLALAALGYVVLSPRIVEPAVALTIAYVGLENAILAAPRRREVVTFAFGLVHGFGFAHILREVGLPRRHLALSLLCFNLGVEVGQVAIVTLLFPVVHLLARGAPGLGTSGLLLALLGLFLGALHLAGVSIGWGVLAYPALLALCILLVRRHGYRPVVLKGGSTAIAAFGLFWLVERLWGRQLLGGRLG